MHGGPARSRKPRSDIKEEKYPKKGILLTAEVENIEQII